MLPVCGRRSSVVRRALGSEVVVVPPEFFEANTTLSGNNRVHILDMSKRLSVGILGYGALGKHMYDAIKGDASISRFFEISFVWNRTTDALAGLPEVEICSNLDDVPCRGADIVVEVSHPSVSIAVAVKVMESGGNFVCGSPTCFSDPNIEEALRKSAATGDGKGNGALYVPVGALWGAADLR